MNLGKSGKPEFLRSGPDGMCMDAICVVWRHGMWRDVFLWEKKSLVVGVENMFSCERRTRLLAAQDYMSMEDVVLFEENIWLWKIFYLISFYRTICYLILHIVYLM